MKPTSGQLARAVSEMGAIPYFPTDSGAQLAVMKQLERFVSGEKELRWLVDTAAGVMREWKGVPELRGLYCTRFKPADGVEANCSLPGYTPEDSEARWALEAGKQVIVESLPWPTEDQLQMQKQITAVAQRKKL